VFRPLARITALTLLAVPLAAQAPRQTAVLAGGCFWGIQNLYEHVHGVIAVTAGYAGGAGGRADYETVSSGTTGHAESVRIVFDPSVVSYGTLLEVFFTVAHDPTELNRQGPDVGTQYRSAIFTSDDAQRRAAEAAIARFSRSHAFPRPIVTQVAPLAAFIPAEAYHQDYAVKHPTDPYIVINDLPKVAHFRARFPALYQDTAARP
jgi:peptide-methionine (S)-S-oxide reductase